MKRFLWGLAMGAASSGVTWVLSHHALLTAVVGLFVALVIWGWRLVDEVGEVIGAALTALFSWMLD